MTHSNFQHGLSLPAWDMGTNSSPYPEREVAKAAQILVSALMAPSCNRENYSSGPTDGYLYTLIWKKKKGLNFALLKKISGILEEPRKLSAMLFGGFQKYQGGIQAPSSRLLDAEPVLLLMALSLRGLEVRKKLLRVRFTVGRRVLQRLITKNKCLGLKRQLEFTVLLCLHITAASLPLAGISIARINKRGAKCALYLYHGDIAAPSSPLTLSLILPKPCRWRGAGTEMRSL